MAVMALSVLLFWAGGIICCFISCLVRQYHSLHRDRYVLNVGNILSVGAGNFLFLGLIVVTLL